MADLQPNAAAPAGNFQPVSEAELEGSPPPPAAQAPAAPASGPTQGYEPVNDNDLAPAAPMFQPGFRGPRGGIPNIPAAAAQRFKDSDAFNNIFQTAATRFANGFVNTFSALTIKDQQAMRDAGYGPGDFNSAGGALRWGAHVFGSTFNVLQDGFLALGPGIIEGVGGAAEQASRETGIGDPEMVGHEASGMAEATMADVGDMHALSMVDAAKAQAKAPGVYSQAFRVDQTPGGGLVHTPMGRLPTEAEAIPQAETVAAALHLPADTADLIHQIYTETGRPPAEVLMDAKANNGGVLSDLVAGKVPEAYPKPDEAPTATPVVAGAPDLAKIPGTIEQAEKLPMAGDNLGGLNVTRNVPNTSSIAASLGDDYSEVNGIRAIPMSEFSGAGKGYVSASDTQRVSELAERIKANGYIDPLIVVMDKDGPYVLEGGHRLDALKQLGHEDVPAMVIVDHGNEHPAATAAYDAIEAKRAADQTAFLKEKGMTQAEASKLPAAEKKQLNTDFQKWRSDNAAQKQSPPLAPAQGVSKIGQSIEAKAVEANLTEGFKNTAGYDKITIADQAERSANLVNNDFDQARAVIRGEQPLPSGLKGVALVTAMEDYIKKNPDADLAYELANSPLVSATSGAAQELRLAAERTPDSATAAIQQIKDAEAPKVTARRQTVNQAKQASAGVLLPKEELSWNKFLDSIACP